jgi:predicted transcriptional regulator
MDAKELKFLLKLLSFPNYRSPLSQIQPTPKMRSLERNSICRELRDRELVACREQIKNLTIAPPGKSLLKIDSTQLPVTPEEIKVLQASSQGTISPGKVGIPAANRETVIEGLANRGFIKTEKEIKEVWLTPRGEQFLVEEYQSNSSSANITLKMLTDYLRLMRKVQGNSAYIATPTQAISSVVASGDITAEKSVGKPIDAQILQIIGDLDRQLGTDNYLPMFHLWEKLKSSMSKDEFDRALYRLQRENKIELSSLQEGTNYTPEQIADGIRLELGGYLFFIIVN